MRKEELAAFKAWFNGYVREFYSSDPEVQAAIRLKEDHTRRVCENAVEIGRSLELDAGDLCLVEAAALFHDVGRFAQFACYRTFNDRESENHAALGVQELERIGVLAGLEEPERGLILTAVRHHNARALPPGLSERELLFSRVVRDADKLDILGVLVRHYTQPDAELGPVLDAGLPDAEGYAPVLVESLLRRENCNYADVRSCNDRKLLNLSWVYDVNFDHTLAEMVRRGYIERIIASLPDTEDIRAVGACIEAYVRERLPR